MIGRGIVDPIDDFRESNPPANEPLLAALAGDFRAHHFDLRHVVRTIMNSRTYQLAVLPNDSNREDDTNFSHAAVRPLQAEVLLDAVSQITGVPASFNGYPLGTRAVQIPGVGSVASRRQQPTDGERFLTAFGKPSRLLTCECERSEDTTLNQAFQLITGELVNRMLTNPQNNVGKLLTAGTADESMVDELFLTALARHPSAREKQASLAMLAKTKDRRAALEDLLWGLINAKEFLLRH